MANNNAKTATLPYIVLTGKVLPKPYRPGTARDLHWKRVQELCANGGACLQQVVYESLVGAPPKLPKNGLVQNPSGWVSRFSRDGLIKVEQRAAAVAEAATKPEPKPEPKDEAADFKAEAKKQHDASVERSKKATERAAKGKRAA